MLWMFLSKSARVKKRLAVIVLLLIMFFGNDFIFTKLVLAWQPKPVTLATGVSYQAGIVLGGISSFDKYGRGYFGSASDRFIETCLLYKTGKIKRIIISGGSNAPGEPKDADFQYRKMIELGIPATDIIIEDSSTTTFENAVFTKRKIDSVQLKPPFVLITSAMHIPRAKMVFKRAGIWVIPFPCDYHVTESRLDFSDNIIPKLSTLFSWSSFIKEVVGIAGYKLFNKA